MDMYIWKRVSNKKKGQTNANQTQTKLNQNFKQTRKRKLIYPMLKQTLKVWDWLCFGAKKITNKMYSGDKWCTTHSTVTNGS